MFKNENCSIFENSSILKNPFKFEKREKTETENGKWKTEENQPRNKKNRLKQVKTGSKFSRRFPKPEKTRNMQLLLGRPIRSKGCALSRKSTQRAETRGSPLALRF
jgi:hypothetical protein